ncbi:hypothetical protein GCM10007147_36660 [Nocardiopsis kunsanensis]|uniref:AbgT family transporter n=1 Tax=Nocardiopsis kunsanensis TaxID=141693 RepID=A0A918XIY1_9ACTN|nr:hypothetical protein GCM10007147_36660 [Nocardiopsis kunsanensis]
MTTSDATRPKLPMRMLLRSLRGIERAGNKLPHPFWLFIIMAVLVILLSAALNAMNVSAESPDGERIEVESLISAEGMQVIFGDAVDNFATFPPLAIIIAVMLGVSVAE